MVGLGGWAVGASALSDAVWGWGTSLLMGFSLLGFGALFIGMGRRQVAGSVTRRRIAGSRPATTLAGVLTIVGGLIFLTNPPLGLWLALAVGIPLAALAIVLCGVTGLRVDLRGVRVITLVGASVIGILRLPMPAIVASVVIAHAIAVYMPISKITSLRRRSSYQTCRGIRCQRLLT